MFQKAFTSVTVVITNFEALIDPVLIPVGILINSLSLFYIGLVAAVHLSMTTNFWVSCGSLMVLCVTPQDCLTLSQGRKARAATKTQFFTCSFFSDSCVIL